MNNTRKINSNGGVWAHPDHHKYPKATRVVGPSTSSLNRRGRGLSVGVCLRLSLRDSIGRQAKRGRKECNKQCAEKEKEREGKEKIASEVGTQRANDSIWTGRHTESKRQHGKAGAQRANDSVERQVHRWRETEQVPTRPEAAAAVRHRLALRKTRQMYTIWRYREVIESYICYLLTCSVNRLHLIQVM
jgi:hypothetical protein